MKKSKIDYRPSCTKERETNGAAPTVFGKAAMPAKQKQVPAADMAMPASHFWGQARCLQSISRCLEQT